MRRQYTEQEKAVALSNLAVHDGDTKKTARFTGIPEPTIRAWKRGRGIQPVVSQKAEDAKRDLADMFEEIARKAIEHAGGVVDESTFAQSMTGAGIAVDKMRLLREQPTTISQTTISDEERDERRRVLAEKVKLRLVG